MENIIKVINARIEETGVKLSFISEKANMTIDALSRTLSGKRIMKGEELISISIILGLSLDDFMLDSNKVS